MRHHRSRLTHPVVLVAVLAGLVVLAAGCSSRRDDGAGGPVVTALAPATDPPGTVPSATVPSVTEPSVTEPSVTEPPATEPPVTVRPAVEARGPAEEATIRTPDGRERSYHVYVPSTVVAAGADGAPVPLLVALHGGVGSGTQFEENSGFDGLAEANGFIVVYPDGVGIGGSDSGAAGRVWNGGGCCAVAVRDQVDDVTFIRMVVADLSTRHRVDAGRVFAAGHSNGGMMAYRLACEASDVFAAIGVQSTALVVDPCRPAQPVSLLHIHGTADDNLPIEGGEGPKSISNYDYPPPIEGVRTMAQADGCTAQPSSAKDATNPDLTIQRWDSCAEGTDVEYVVVEGAPHAWMGHPTPRALTSSYGRLDSSAVIWSFLAAQGR